jgi:hypothetical protein
MRYDSSRLFLGNLGYTTFDYCGSTHGPYTEQLSLPKGTVASSFNPLLGPFSLNSCVTESSILAITLHSGNNIILRLDCKMSIEDHHSKYYYTSFFHFSSSCYHMPIHYLSILTPFISFKMLVTNFAIQTILAGLYIPVVLGQGFNITALSAVNGISQFQCWQLKEAPARKSANGIVQWPVGNAVGMDISFMPKNLIINPSKPRVPL